jgi:Transcriptional regulator
MSVAMKEDRRVRKTKQALRESLAELLTEKSIQNITIRELTDKADIHRSTFYANFTDIYDLHSQIEDSIIQEISNIFSENRKTDSTVFFEILFTYISENGSVCRMFLGKNVSPTFCSRLTALLKEARLDCLRDNYGVTDTAEELEYYAHFYLFGSLAVVDKWADENFKYSIEQLVKIFANMDINFGNFIKSKFAQ